MCGWCYSRAMILYLALLAGTLGGGLLAGFCMGRDFESKKLSNKSLLALRRMYDTHDHSGRP